MFTSLLDQRCPKCDRPIHAGTCEYTVLDESWDIEVVVPVSE